MEKEETIERQKKDNQKLENKILKLENKVLKLEQTVLKLQKENQEFKDATDLPNEAHTPL